MFSKPPARQAPPDPSSEDPSGALRPAVKPGPLRWLRNILGRSIRLEKRRNQLHVAIVDRREPVAEKPVSLLSRQRAELGSRLLVHDPATQAVSNLVVVHDELRANGWAGIEALPLKVIDRALTEAEILGVDEPSPTLATIIANLRQLKDGAEARAAVQAADREWETIAVPEVTDTNYDDYELMERSWAGTQPAGLGVPSRR